MTYLVIRFQSVGNVAMTVPVLESVCRLHPQDTFVMVAKKRLSPLFYGLPNVRFHEADFSRGGLKGLLQLFHELRTYSIDAVIDLQDVLRTKILRFLFRLVGVRNYVVDYGRVEKRKMALQGTRHLGPLPTEFERYRRAFELAGLATDEAFTTIPVNVEASSAIEQLYGVKTERWIGVAPFAKSKTNTWAYQCTKDLIVRLSRTPNTRVYLFGSGKIECELLRQWASIMPNVVNAAGVLPLEQELELMRHLDVMICMDSANQHLASVVGTRVITLWMGTHPNMGFAAWKQQPSDRIQRDMACRPCTVHGTNHCRFGNYLCQQIDVNTVLERI